jgi:hypothetical protein
MAAPLGRSATVRLLEETVELIRQVRFGALIYHWVGSVPLAVGVLFAWRSVTDLRTTDVRWGGESLLLALLLIWMNCWRGVYSGKLRSHLSGVPDRPWDFARVFQLAAIQSLAAASKLLVLPFAVLILFPWAKTVAFYRNLSVLAGRDQSPPREVARRAHRLAGFRSGQNWVLLGLLFLFQAILAVKLALLLGLLPQVVRILTGYESAYSRSGFLFILNPVFVLSVLAVCWILFDPFAQAAHSIRSFEAESSETGEDLRCGLRRIRALAPVTAAVALFAAILPVGRAEIAPGDLNRSIQQVMQAPEYDWRLPKASAGPDSPWLSGLDRLITSIRHAVSVVVDGAGNILRRIFESLFPRSSGNRPGAPPGGGLNWTVIALIALVVAAGGLFAWQRSRWRRPPTKPQAPQLPQTIKLDAPDLTPDLLPEDRWVELAEACLVEGNYRLALRALYLACLAWLGRRQYLGIHAAKTNRDYAAEFNRRTRELPVARDLFAGSVARFERAWYGLHPVSLDDTVEFRQGIERMKTELSPPRRVS